MAREAGRLRGATLPDHAEPTALPPAPQAPSPASGGGPSASCSNNDRIPSTTRSIFAGIGFRHATPADEIVALIRRALGDAGLPVTRLAGIATAADRAAEPAIRAAAAALGLEPIALPPGALRAVDALVVTRSPRIEAARGLGSLAEAAALAAAGPGARLILPRIASAEATCALACRDEIGVSGLP